MNKDGIIYAFNLVLKDYQIELKKAQQTETPEDVRVWEGKIKTLTDANCFITRNLDIGDEPREKAIERGNDL